MTQERVLCPFMPVLVSRGARRFMDMKTTQFLTADQVAERWQITPRTIREMAQAGEIPAARFGRRWRFPLEQLEKYEKAAQA
ncbi:helix-turn-helix DNA binding protein [Gordonia phage Octobien14]|uniref:Helix-turn-helix DNA binding protein n=1 Tax=Gordonia phage Octobien14 TaxID=2483673 RepID=A0A3G3M9L1_9CAUD|nr:HTH DNA binding protein [Gordonia phage Octobien14]AYR03153.1 helix-turn-helix DNA binding protein [Gordonia phage Octobien14]